MMIRFVALFALFGCVCANLDLNDDYFDALEFLPSQTLRAPFYPVGNTINSWKFAGNAIATEEYIRITSQLRGQQGVLYNEEPLGGADLDVFVELKVHGSPQGADGMALWLTEAPIREVGHFLGGPTKWKGAAVVLDSFDNDSRGNNPRIGVLVNDGTKFAAKDADGSELDVGGCMYGFRNLQPGLLLHIRVKQGLLSLGIGNKNTELSQFHRCAHEVPIALPKQTYLSITAETGGLTDNHDVLSVAAFTEARDDDEDDHHQPDEHDDDHDEPEQHSRQQQQRQQQEHRPARDAEAQVGEPSDEELEKGLPEHHTKPPLAFHFNNIFKDLKDISEPHHPDHEAFKEDLQLMRIGSLTNDEQRYAFAMEGLFNMEEHTDLMIKAFERILASVDNERFRVQQNHHQFAEGFNALYESVATKKDVEEALQSLAGKRSLLKASRKIHKLVDSALDSVEGSDSPLGRLGVIAKSMDPQGREMAERHGRNRAALSRAQAELAALMRVARESGGMSTVDWIMLFEIAAFAVFALIQLLRKKQKQSIL